MPTKPRAPASPAPTTAVGREAPPVELAVAEAAVARVDAEEPDAAPPVVVEAPDLVLDEAPLEALEELEVVPLAAAMIEELADEMLEEIED